MQTSLAAPSPWPRRLAGAFLILSLLFLGFVAGILVATRLLATSAMGWDQLADALGGAAIGMLAGAAAGALLLPRLGGRHRSLVALVALAAAVSCWLYLRTTPPRVAPTEKPSMAMPPGGT